MLKKVLCLLLTVVMAAGIFVNCYAKAAEPVTVSMWVATVTPERDAFYKSFAELVHKTYPNITLDYLGVPGDISAFNQKLDVAIAADQAPDITPLRTQLIPRGFYEPLDKYFESWSDKNKISAGAVAGNRSADAKYHRLYALPATNQTWNMWIRPDVIKAANLPVPKTWDQFFDDAKKLTNKQAGMYGYSIRGGAGSANTLEMLMYSYSGITNYFTPNGKATINNSLNVKFVEKYLGGYGVNTPEDDLSKGWTELAATFQSGKTAMIFHNLGSASSHDKAFNGDKSKYEAIPFPQSLLGYVVHPALQPLGLCMTAKCKHKDEAWKVITLFSSKSVDSAYGKLVGELPSNTEAAKDSWVTSLPYMKMGAKLLNSPNVKFNKTPYYLPGYSNIQQEMEPLIQKVMAKKMTAKEMLDTWASKLEKEKASFDASLKK